jgi:hypothetical protein
MAEKGREMEAIQRILHKRTKRLLPLEKAVRRQSEAATRAKLAALTVENRHLRPARDDGDVSISPVFLGE